MSRLAGIRFNFPLVMIGRNLSRLFGLKFSAGKQGSCNNHLRRPEAIEWKDFVPAKWDPGSTKEYREMPPCWNESFRK